MMVIVLGVSFQIPSAYIEHFDIAAYEQKIAILITSGMGTTRQTWTTAAG
jgi:hypothetical protein